MSAARAALSAARAWNLAYAGAGGQGERAFSHKALERVVVALEECEESGTLAELGQLLAGWYQAAAGLPADEGLAPTPAERVAWEALVAHLYLLVHGGEDEDLARLEPSWGPWAHERLATLGD